MASRTPAAFLGLDRELGRVAPGYRADLVAWGRGWMCWARGSAAIRPESARAPVSG